ncbi:MAG TPA: hypothetical protein VGH98_19700 [Gemmatimonadaceae bacterium]
MSFSRPPEGKPAVDRYALGQRSKLGGKPDWQQYDGTPSCNKCRKRMPFVAQIDSIEHNDATNPHAVSSLSQQQHYMFADVGMLYVFFCFDCLMTHALLQF